ncbi:Uncharacterised protein [Enterobacter cloacae]|nr:Uncharacterised protein [Enterobacter cloacae]
MNHYQGLLVGREFRVGVVVADEGYPVHGTAVHVHLVDLRLAATVRGEVQGRAVLAPEGFGIDRQVVGQAAQGAATKVHDVDFRVAVARQDEGQAVAVRGECRSAIQALEIGDLLTTASIDVLDEDTRALLFEGDIGDTAAIGREARRHDGLARLQQGHRAGAVVVGALQGVAGVVDRETLGGDIEHLGGERALDTGELLERLVGDVVRHVAELIGAAGHAAGQDLLLGADIEQCVLHLQASAGRHDVADHHVVDANCLPVTEDHFAGLRRLADHVLPGQRLEVAGVAQVVADDIGHVFRQHVAPLEAERHHGDGNGTVVTAGDHQRVGSLRSTCHQGQGEQRNANQGTHRLKSSGLKMMRR